MSDTATTEEREVLIPAVLRIEPARHMPELLRCQFCEGLISLLRLRSNELDGELLISRVLIDINGRRDTWEVYICWDCRADLLIAAAEAKAAVTL